MTSLGAIRKNAANCNNSRTAAELHMRFSSLGPRLPRAQPLQVVTDVLTVPRALELLLPGHVVPLQVRAAAPSAQSQVQQVVVGLFNRVAKLSPTLSFKKSLMA